MAEFYRKKKKVCYMCTTGKDINYKDVDILKKYGAKPLFFSFGVLFYF